MFGEVLGESPWLIFQLDNRNYGLGIDCVAEVMPVLATQHHSRMPHDWLGVANIRGTTTPVVDLRARFGLEQTAPAINAPLILVRYMGRQIALLVDNVQGISYLPEDHARAAENDGSVLYNNQLITLLDWKKLVEETPQP
jgi:purine-binding chemotaxis protein CheW